MHCREPQIIALAPVSGALVFTLRIYRWNSEGRDVCDYAQRGLRCGDPQWRDEWREAMADVED